MLAVIVIAFFSVLPFTAKALNLLFLVKKFPYANQMYIINQVTGLIDRGHTVTILAQQKGDEPSCSALFGYEKKYALLCDDLPKNKQTYDVVLCQMAELDEWYTALKRRGLQGKTIVFCRGWDVSSLLRRNPHRYNTFFAETDMWLPVCDYFKRRLIAYGYDARKINVLGSSIDCKKFRRHAEKKEKSGLCIVTTARLVPKKGIEYALRAVARVVKRYPKIKYIIIGTGKWKSRLQKLANDLNIHKNVQFVGHKTHEEIITILQDADMYIQPSVTSADFNQEGIPNALKEAMAMELPVISTYHAGIPELVEHAISGLLVPEKDISALGVAIADLIEDADKRNQLGRVARKKVVEVYDSDVINDQLHNLLIHLVEESGYD